MSKHKFYVWCEPHRIKKFRTTMFLHEFGRMKIRSVVSTYFYTSKSKSVKDIKSRHKDGTLKELFIYED